MTTSNSRPGSNQEIAKSLFVAEQTVKFHLTNIYRKLGVSTRTEAVRYAYENGFELAVRVDGDGQHDPAQLGAVVDPVLRGEVDIAVGSRYLERRDGYRSSATRRVGIRLLARTVSALTGQRITDPTSGFQALNRKAITLFAADYPHDYPEVEALVMLIRHRLRLKEVPVAMRPRAAGRSSIRALSSVYYMVKVLLALFVGSFRRNVVPLEEK